MISHAKPSKPTIVPLIKKKQAAGSKRSEVGGQKSEVSKQEND